MKKTFLVFCLAFICLGSNAQFGVKGGATFSNFSGSDADDAKMLVGFYLGVLYNAMISETFSIQPELVYAGQGAKYDDGDEYTIRLGYINLAALIRYNFASGFFLGTGPQLGFLLSAKLKVDDEDEDIKDEFKSTDFAWAFAIGYEMASGFGFYGRYNLGLASVIDQDDVDLKNTVIMLGLRYILKAKTAQSYKPLY